MGLPVFLPGWETVSLIGSGGFSKVYKIKKIDDSSVGFYSALKVINVPASAEEYNQYVDEGCDEKSISDIFRDQVKRIVSEFEMMSSFKGTANIVSYEDHMILKKKDGKGYVVLIRMELLETLTAYHKVCPLDETQVVKLGIDICRALRLCAEQNIVHRDIKPQNIFVNKFGDFKLGDFGIARVMDHATKATKIGTPSYISPEVYLGRAYDCRADIYSLGLVMYWLLNDRRLPFIPLPPETPTPSKTEEAFLTRIGGAQIPPPKNGSKELKEIVLKACAYNSEDRFSSAEELEQCLEDQAYFLKNKKNKANNIHKNDNNIPQNDGLSDGVIEKSTSMEHIRKNDTEGDDKADISVSLTKDMLPQTEEKSKEAVLDDFHLTSKTDNQRKNEGNRAVSAKVAKKKKRPLLISVILVIFLGFVGAIAAVVLDEMGFFATESSGEEVFSAPEESTVLSEEVSEAELTDANGYALDFSWSLNKGVLTISGTGKMPDYTTYAPWIERFSEINQVVLSKGLTSVGSRAFYGCLALKEVVISEGIESIGNDAFAGCAALSSVVLPEGVKIIGERAFRDCTALKSLNIPATVDKIGKEAFYYCSSLENVIIPEGVEKIEERTFYYCTAFTEVNIPETIKIIEGYAFYECTNVETVKGLSCVENIGSYAFYENTSLTSIILPETLSSVGEWAFAGCSSLKSISFPKKVTALSPFVLCAASALEKVEFSADVSRIDSGAFRGCTSLEKIGFGGTVLQWNNISKDPNWDYNTPLYSVMCADGMLEKHLVEESAE